MTVIVSVPGKVHLMGEHAVVYGKPAILAAVDMRMHVSVEPAETETVIQTSEPTEYIEKIIAIVCDKYDIQSPPQMRIVIESEIPAGFHLGSSAATAVATVGALTYFLKNLWNPQVINQLAYEAEKIKHGNPSGGDNTTVTMGGFVWYRKELEFLKSMWQLPVRFPKEFNHFYLIDTGRPKETTKEMVEYVAESVKKQKEKYRRLFDVNEIQTKRIAIALKENNETELLDAIKIGEQTLERMGVVSDKVKPIVRTIESLGGVAKILGGGGRSQGVGFLLVYHKDKKTIEEIGKKFGFQVRPIVLGSEGVRLDRKQ
jgi:mevalonate kinase